MDRLPCKILYAGQDFSLFQALEAILKRHWPSYCLQLVTNLEELKGALEKEPLHVFLFDSNFAPFNGGEDPAFQQILQLSSKVPTVLLVDRDHIELGQRAIERGVFDYLVKVDGLLTALPYTINRALEQTRCERPPSPVSKPPPEMPSERGFFEVNESGRFIHIDEKVQEITGLAREELFRLYLPDLLAELDREEFYKWRSLTLYETKRAPFHIHTEIVHPEKGLIPVEVHLEPPQRDFTSVSAFRGYLKVRSTVGKSPELEEEKPSPAPLDIDFFERIWSLNDYLKKGLHQLFLMRLTEIPLHLFQFNRAALYLYYPEREGFTREISLAETESEEQGSTREVEFYNLLEVKRLFGQRELVRLVRTNVHQGFQILPEDEILQKALRGKESFQPELSWQPENRVLINLANGEGYTLCFLSLEEPKGQIYPSLDAFRRMEIYALCASGIYENYLRLVDVQKKHRRLKQIFITLGAYPIGLPIEDLLQEVVWSVKFSLGFRLVMLGILAKGTRQLEIKAVAMENKEKARTLRGLHFSLTDIAAILKERYKLGNSYYLSEKDNTFSIIKRIYRPPASAYKDERQWGYEDLLLVPIRSRNSKIIGFIILDDPEDHRKPDSEVIQILERIAAIVAVTLENKIAYLNLKKQMTGSDNSHNGEKGDKGNRIHRILRRISL